MFSLELFLPFVELVDDCIEMLQIFPILANQVFGAVQEFFRGGVLECTVPKVYAL